MLAPSGPRQHAQPAIALSGASTWFAIKNAGLCLEEQLFRGCRKQRFA
jgi:hypothetical protein